MAIPAPSILSNVTELIRARLASALFTTDDTYDVTVDTPSSLMKTREANASRGYLNLFFYRFEPSGLFGDDALHNRWQVRTFCMITAFSAAGSETVGEGTNAVEVQVSESEIDFRVLGEVLRHFYESPEMNDDALGVYLRAILSPLSSDEINQIWSTQGDTTYRPSLLYEFTLIPIEPRRFVRPDAPLVAGGLSLDSRADLEARDDPVLPVGVIPSPQLEAGSDVNWVPQVTLISATNEIVQTLSFPLAGAPASVPVWIAGPDGEDIDIIWQQSAKGVWVDLDGPRDTRQIPAQSGSIGQLQIDPEADPGVVATLNVDLPPGTEPRQYLLFVERNDNGTLRRSNPLIITIGDIWS